MNLRLVLGLLLINSVWAMNPVMGKLALQDFMPAHAAWIKVLLGFFVLTAVIFLAQPNKFQFSNIARSLKNIQL